MWILAPTCYLLPSSVSGEIDRLPHPSPTTWRLTLAYGGRCCQPAARHRVHVEGKAPRRATQMGRSRVQPLAPSLHWLISTRSRYSQQEPGWKRQFIHEKCNIEAILGRSRAHEFTLHKHTHSGKRRRKRGKVEFKKKQLKQWGISFIQKHTGARKETDGWEAGWSVRWTPWIWNRIGWRREHGGAETSICKCSQTVLAESLVALSRLVKAPATILSVSYSFIYYMSTFYYLCVFFYI